MRTEWEPLARDGLARRGVWRIGSVEIDTPALLVVVDPDPRKQLVPIDELRKLGVKTIMTSSFIARRKIGVKKLKGVLNWGGILYTDSGTYQAYSQGVSVDPIESVKYQVSVDVDIVTPVDEFSLPTDNYNTALKKALVSFERWKKAKEIVQDKILSAPIQGGIYSQIRGYITRKYVEEGAHLLAVGGIVPLMINYDFDRLVDVLIPVTISRPQGTVVHAFGAGHPLLFPLLVASGVDVFDSAMYILAAKDGRYLTPWGTFRIDELLRFREFPCDCPVCSKLSPRDLEGMSKTETQRFLAYHNLYVALKTVKRIREMIEYGTFNKWLLSFSHTHPRLYEGVYRLYWRWRRAILNSRNSDQKTSIPRGYALSNLVIQSRQEGPLTNMYTDFLRYSYGINKRVRVFDHYQHNVFVTDHGSVILLPSSFRLCPDSLLNLGLVVKLTDECDEKIRKKEIDEMPHTLFGANAYMIGHDTYGNYCLIKSLASYVEIMMSRENDIVFTRSSRPSQDPTELPCRTGRIQQ